MNIKFHLAIFAIGVFLSIVLSWPLILNIGSYYTDQGDYPLAGSVLWWNSDSIKSGRILNPKEYWQGYQFYSQPYSLAFVNNSFVPSLIFAPIYWLSENLPFSLNSYALLTLVLSFIASFYTIHYFMDPRFRGDDKHTVFLASLAGAFIFTFNPLTMVRFPHHLDILGKYFLPLVFLFAYKLLEKPTIKKGFLFGLFFTLNALTVNYYQIFSVVILPFVTLPFLWSNLRRGNWGYFGKLGKSGLVGLIFLPILLYFNLPYLQFAQKEGAGHRVEESVFFSARINDWFGLSPDSLLYGSWTKYLESYRFPKDDRGILNYEEHTLALLILPTVLFILGFRIFLKEKLMKSFFLIMLGVTFILIFGPYFVGFSEESTLPLPFYFLYKIFPFMQGIRSPTRFEFVFYIPFAMIAAFGAKWILEKRAAPSLPAGRQVGLAMTMLIILILENFTVRSYDQRSAILPQIYERKEELAFLQGETTIHLPIYTLEDADVFGKGSAYLNWLTVTGEKIFNGNSAYLPPDQISLLFETKVNPDRKALTKLSLLGVNFVVVHKDLLTNMDPVKDVGKVAYEDEDILILDISNLKAELIICAPERDFEFRIAKAQDENLNLSHALVIQNHSDCFLPSVFENRYQKMEIEVEGVKKVAYFRLPLLINPKEQVILSEINRELKIE